MSGAFHNSKRASASEMPANRPSPLVGRPRAVHSAAMNGPRGEATDGDPESGIHTDFRETMAYADYLRLDSLLAAQAPLSDSHDELLFIVLHQATELWFKLMLHEIAAATARLRADQPQQAFKMLARVSRIQAQVIQSWDILSTLTPPDYLAFRDRLGRASGLQSRQYRLLEFAMGNKNAAMIEPFAHLPEVAAELAEALARPSLYDESIRLLARRGFAIPESGLGRDFARPYEPQPRVEAAWRAVYQDVARHWELYELAEDLVDVADWFQQWRFRHVTTVERIIGRRRGTGGSSGVAYLRGVLDRQFFPELWSVRTSL